MPIRRESPHQRCCGCKQGDFAKAQAEYLQPDVGNVAQLVDVLSSKRIGIVAHFYMDPQVF